MSLERIDTYVKEADALLRRRGIQQADLVDIDTVCYDTPSNDRYDELKREFAQRAFLIDETEVNGRLIAVLEFHEPLEVEGHRLTYLELPQPKRPDTEEGISHVQYVTRQGISRFRSRYSAIAFEEKGNPLNRLLQLSGDLATVRFHDKHMGAVLEQEKNHD